MRIAGDRFILYHTILLSQACMPPGLLLLSILLCSAALQRNWKPELLEQNLVLASTLPLRRVDRFRLRHLLPGLLVAPLAPRPDRAGGPEAVARMPLCAHRWNTA